MNFQYLKQIQKKSIEQRKTQKEQLRLQFINREKKMEEKKDDLSPILSTDLLREKNLRKKAKKESKSLQKRLLRERQINSTLKLELEGAKQQLAQLKEKNWELTQQVSELEMIKQQLKVQEEKMLDEQKIRIELENKIKDLAQQTKQDLKIGQKLLKLTNQVKQLKESNRYLRQKLKNYNIITSEQYGNLNHKVEKLQRELNKYKKLERQFLYNPSQMINYISQNITDEQIPELLHLLDGFITPKNLNYFYRGQYNVFYLMMRRVNLIKHQLEKRNEQYHLEKTVHGNQWERLGYLDKTENGCFFVDLTEGDDIQRFEVKTIECGEEVQSDQPVKARVQEKYAIITECYPIEYPESVKKPASSVKVKQKTKNYLYLGPFRVLVVGARFLSEYKDRLEKHGCIVEIHNPYEESYELLKGKISRAEIILVCERHVAHSVWDHVDKSQPYVSVLRKDSKDLISTYTYLTLKRCELI